MRTVTLYNTPPVPSELVEKAGGAVPIHIQFIPYAKALWKDDPEWQKLLTAVNRKESVSGTPELDHTVAIQKLLTYIGEQGNLALANTQLLIARKAFSWTRRRLGIGLEQRRKLGGVAITDQSEAPAE